MPDPSYEILPKRGQCPLSYGDDEYKDKDKDRKSSKKNELMNTGLSSPC